MDRRKFIETITILLSSIIGIVLAIPVFGHLIAPAFKSRQEKWFELMSKYDLPPPGAPEPVNFSVNRHSGWVNVKEQRTVFIVTDIDKDGNLYLIKVLSNICSHLGCNVRWNDADNVFKCPCHNGTFSHDGTQLSGPPPRPLAQLKHHVNGDKIFVQTEI